MTLLKATPREAGAGMFERMFGDSKPVCSKENETVFERFFVKQEKNEERIGSFRVLLGPVDISLTAHLLAISASFRVKFSCHTAVCL
jgi:hypothetical protein